MARDRAKKGTAPATAMVVSSPTPTPVVENPISNLFKFNFEGKRIRTAKSTDGSNLFIAKDICSILEIDNSRQAVSRLDADEVEGVISNDTLGFVGGAQRMQAVTEAGFWKLVLSSRSEKVKPFIRFITHVVIPSIRATGFYVQEGREEAARDEMNRILLEKAMDKYEALWSVELPAVLSKV